MRLWKRASGALKDRKSILVASLARRNPDIESAVIKATSHDESKVDYRNVQRVFSWIRLSPAYHRPFLLALSVRMEKTRSWVVALKGLMLMHGVFYCKVPALQKIGRLPIDLSSFKDGHASPAKTWGYDAFVRAFYTFLDQKSAFICMDMQERKARSKERIQEQQPILQELVSLQKMQGLLDMLLQIKPEADGMVNVLIVEAMDCVIIEIYDIYRKICNGIAKVLARIYSAGKVEASMALKVLQKATMQGEELFLYFQYCRDMGIFNASECPKVEQVPEEDIQKLESIINGVSGKTDMNYCVPQEDRAIVDEQKDFKITLQTIITNHWDVFDEDLIKVNGDAHSQMGKTTKKEDPFAAPLFPPVHPYRKYEDLPDLISF